MPRSAPPFWSVSKGKPNFLLNKPLISEDPFPFEKRKKTHAAAVALNLVGVSPCAVRVGGGGRREAG